MFTTHRNCKGTQEMIDQVSQELDYLGLPVINKNADITDQLCHSIIALINLHRRVQEDNRSLQHDVAAIHKEHNLKSKTILSLMNFSRKVANEKEGNDIENLKLQNKFQTSETNIKELKKSVESLKLNYTANEHKWNLRFDKLNKENEELKCFKSDRGECSHSVASLFTAELSKCKRRERIFKETISKLQENNELLIEQILNLEQQVRTQFTAENNK